MPALKLRELSDILGDAPADASALSPEDVGAPLRAMRLPRASADVPRPDMPATAQAAANDAAPAGPSINIPTWGEFADALNFSELSSEGRNTARTRYIKEILPAVGQRAGMSAEDIAALQASVSKRIAVIKPPQRDWGEALISDPLNRFARGVAGGVAGSISFFDPQNKFAKELKDEVDQASLGQGDFATSAYARDQQRAYDEAVNAAEPGAPRVGKILTEGVKRFGTVGSGAVSEGLGSTATMLIPGLGAQRAAQALGAAAKVAERIGLGAGATAGGVMEGGSARAQAFDALINIDPAKWEANDAGYRTLVAGGMSSKDAIAERAKILSLENVPLPALLGIFSATTGVTGIIGRGVERALVKTPVKQSLLSGTTELGGEVATSVASKVGENRLARSIDQTTPLTKDVDREIGETILATTPLAGAAGIHAYRDANAERAMPQAQPAAEGAVAPNLQEQSSDGRGSPTSDGNPDGSLPPDGPAATDGDGASVDQAAGDSAQAADAAGQSDDVDAAVAAIEQIIAQRAGSSRGAAIAEATATSPSEADRLGVPPAGARPEEIGAQRSPAVDEAVAAVPPTGDRTSGPAADEPGSVAPERVRALIGERFPQMADRIDLANVSDLAPENSDVEGWFDQNTGRITIVPENIAPVLGLDAEQRATWVAGHELAHAGLAGEAYRNALFSARRNPTVQAIAKAMLAERAGKPDSIHSAPLVATEEAIAELAGALETGNFDAIEQRYGVKVADNAVHRNALQRVVDGFVSAIKSFATSLGLPATLTDAQAIALARKAVSRAGRQTAPQSAPQASQPNAQQSEQAAPTPRAAALEQIMECLG